MSCFSLIPLLAKSIQQERHSLGQESTTGHKFHRTRLGIELSLLNRAVGS